MIVENNCCKNRLVNLKDFTLPELKNFFREIGEPPFRAIQVAEWIFGKGVNDFNLMTNLSVHLRQRLAELSYIGSVVILKKKVSALDGTIKYLMGMRDGQAVETVLMKYSYGQSVCISTQVGCNMGCVLCASTIEGKMRNLTSGEMYAQIQAVQEDSGQRVSNLVVMGSGEPLDNFHHTVNFLINVNAEYGYNIGFRHITLSTCGLVPQIKQLADLGFPITLAVSLHAPEDSLRSKLMPINIKYPLKLLMDACRYYIEKTGRRITFEYVMLQDVNDSLYNAEKLVDLVKGIPCHINLIPYNPISERSFSRSSKTILNRFKIFIEDAGIDVTVRRELGADIDAACGQLRRSNMFSYTR